MTQSLWDSSMEMEFLVSDDSSYFSHHKMLQYVLHLKVTSKNVVASSEMGVTTLFKKFTTFSCVSFKSNIISWSSNFTGVMSKISIPMGISRTTTLYIFTTFESMDRFDVNIAV